MNVAAAVDTTGLHDMHATSVLLHACIKWGDAN